MTDPNIREGQIVDGAREAVSEKMSEMWWTFLPREMLLEISHSWFFERSG